MNKIKKILCLAIAVSFFASTSLNSLAKVESQSVDGSRRVTAVLNGKKKKYSVPLDSSIYQTIFALPDSYCHGCTLSERDSVLITREDQQIALQPLVNWIKKQNKKPDSQVRIAASLVQKIPYDWDKYNNGDQSGRGHGTRYPYEVLYDNKGICGDMSYLMAFLLKELGFGTAVFYLNDNGANHMVAGVKCPSAYDYKDSGYCYIESVQRRMITYEGSYGDQNPLVVPLSDGRTFSSANKDAKDAATWRKLMEEGVSSSKNYKKYKKMKKKYGI